MLFVNRPMQRVGSSLIQFRKRVPDDVLKVAKGKLVTISLPPEDTDGDPILVNVTIGPDIRFSLRTRDPALAKIRNAAATEQLGRAFNAFLRGAQPLTKKQRIALSGLLYKAFADNLEDDPGDPEIWKRVQEANEYALKGKLLTIDTFPGEGRLRLLDERFGALVDAILRREGIVTDVLSRRFLLEEAGHAINEAARKLQRNAEGDYSPDPVAARFPAWEGAQPQRAAPLSSSSRPSSLTFEKLLSVWEREGDKSPSTKQAFRSVVKAFSSHLGHAEPARVTKDDVRAWRDTLLEKGLSAKTINGTYLAHIQALYRLAKREDLIDFDPVDGTKVRMKKKAGTAMKPYSDEEVSQILAFADKETASALHWVPWILALTGARVGEIAQLWGEHIKQIDGVAVLTLTLTEDGGTVKTAASERDVPIHPALIERGFLDFVKSRGSGPLFYGGKLGRARPRKNETAAHASKGTANRVREWIRGKGFNDPRKAPNHAFRHWFKSACVKAGILESVADAIQGHVGKRGEADTYRHFDLATLREAILKIKVPRQPAS
ncbi:site-specific integrase [Rhodomicrobium lacus]|uniref:site-specific integrase n=1 Tax=Rhodomicrobium lacus TaxID=2498452 RepID=UPI000F8E89F8|nr:site-specific integrase [Rhodomicrobium lacus]